MRATLFLMLCFILLGIYLWVTFSGALLLLGYLVLVSFLVVTLGYSDTMILFLLGAREVRSRDEKNFFEAASQESYKLAVSMPKLYYYNGSLERVFVLQKGADISIILDKRIMENAQTEELKAICFELLLQVKKGLAPKRTRAMFIIGSISWLIRAFFTLITSILPFQNVRKGFDWVVSFFLRPVLDVLFNLLLGEGYFKKLEALLSDYPLEKQELDKVGMRLSRDQFFYSLPSRKLLEFSSADRSRHFQNIMTLEFLPHEWDYFFQRQDLKNVQ